MADTKLSALTSVTGASLANGDLFFLLDIDDNTFSSTYKTEKKITRAELVAGLATRVTFSDAAKTLDAADRYVGQTGTMSAARIVTLQAANAVPAGAVVIIADESGSVTQDNRIEIKAAGSDTIDGVLSSSNFPVIRSAYGSFELMSDGSSKWTVLVRRPSIDVQTFTSTGSNTWRKPFGCSRARGILIAGGAGCSGFDGSQAGGLTAFDVPTADLSPTETVTVGAGGTSGSTTGGDTHFSSSSKWIAQGGDATSTAGMGTVIGAIGGTGSISATPATDGAAGLSSATSGPFAIIAPGGGGGRNTYDNSVGAGGNSSKGVGTNAAGLAGGTAGQNNSNGGNGTSSTSISATSIFGGAGGGGAQGGSSTGGNGGLYGGGAGGGSSSGGQGAAIIESY